MSGGLPRILRSKSYIELKTNLDAEEQKAWADGVRDLFKQNPENVIVHHDFYPGEEVRVWTTKQEK